MKVADIEFREVDPPEDFWCECGHIAPKVFKRGGPDSEPKPTKFWRMKGAGQDKIICEPCLVIINHTARLKKSIQKERERHG